MSGGIEFGHNVYLSFAIWYPRKGWLIRLQAPRRHKSMCSGCESGWCGRCKVFTSTWKRRLHWKDDIGGDKYTHEVWERNVSGGSSYKGGDLSRSGGGWVDDIAPARKEKKKKRWLTWPHSTHAHFILTQDAPQFLHPLLLCSLNSQQKRAV